MGKYVYELQETRTAFGGRPPLAAYERVSRHTSARAAWRALSRHRRAMLASCGGNPYAWTHHHRIVRLRDGLDVTFWIDTAREMSEPDWGMVDAAETEY